jgi:hypothetical protein
MKRAREASKPERRARRDNAPRADNRGSPRPAGHGAKCRHMKAAIAALLTQRNVADAAHVLGIGTTTLYRWMKTPEFIAAYREARLAAFGRASARLRQASGSAVTTIWNLMIDPGSPASVKVKACELGLQHAAAASEDDIAAWLSELKRERPAIRSFLAGDRRTFDEIQRLPPKVAA